VDTLRVHGSLYGRICRPLVLAASESLTIDTPEDWAEAERRLLGREAERAASR